MSKSIRSFEKRLKQVSPVVMKTVKKAKKGIKTTVSLCKKSVRTELVEEPSIVAWDFVIKLVANLMLKASKESIRKGRLPKFKFITKHLATVASYFGFLPVVMVTLIYSI